MCSLCPLSKVDRIITGKSAASTRIVRGLARAKVEVLTVPFE
jgi:hypothetical protein